MASVGNSGIFTLEEFYNRGVIKLAPDVLVYIGGSLQTSVIAPVSSTGNDNLSFNDGITAVNIQNNVDPPGSSTASIEITTPIYGQNSNYWASYNTGGPEKVRLPVFVPMLEVKIYIKGRYMVDMKPRYYAAFWGLITNVEESYNGGMFKINVSCVDILHWWAYSSINIHPVPESRIASGGGQKLTVFSTIFDRQNPFNIIYTLNSNMGMHEFVTPSWVAQKTSLSENYPVSLFKKATSGIMEYWANRLQNPGNLLKMYGISGRRVNEKGITKEEPTIPVKNTAQASGVLQATQTKQKLSYNIDDRWLRNFEIFADYENMGTFESAEYTTKLEIATEVKTRCNYEFFQDTNGNFVFKPPFYNMNVKGLMNYTIVPNEIINYAVNTDSEGIITVLNVTTPMYKNLKNTSYDLGQGFHMDIDLAQRYGIRYRTMIMEYIDNAKMARTLALGQMSQINAKTITGNVTIPIRPEIKLGYPIYIEHRDSFHYVKSINHSFEYGGTATTTLSLETERQKVPEVALKKYNNVANKGNSKNKIALTATYMSTYQTNTNLIYKLAEATTSVKKAPTQAQTGVKSDSTANPEKFVQIKDAPPVTKAQGAPTINQKTKEEQLAIALLGSKIISNQEGRYDIIQDPNIISTTTDAVPLSDADGYRVIGSFPYGRNINPLVVAPDIEAGPNVYKDVYIATMARPIYQNESAAMSSMFFSDKEGSTPVYLNTGNSMPKDLGAMDDVLVNGKLVKKDQDVLPSEKQATAANPALTPAQSAAITNAQPVGVTPIQPVGEPQTLNAVYNQNNNTGIV